MSVENKIRQMMSGKLNENFPGMGKNKEDSAPSQGSSQHPEIQQMHKDGMSASKPSGGVNKLAAGAGAKESAPMKQGSSQDASIDLETTQDNQGKAQASKKGKQTVPTQSGAGSAPNYTNVSDPRSVINQSSSKGNVQKEETEEDEELEVISEEEYNNLSDEEKAEWEEVELVEEDEDDDEEIEVITEEEYDSLSEEEKAEWEEVEIEDDDEDEDLDEAAKWRSNPKAYDTHDDPFETRADDTDRHGADTYKKSKADTEHGYGSLHTRPKPQISKKTGKITKQSAERLKARIKARNEEVELEEGNAENKAKKNAYIDSLPSKKLVKNTAKYLGVDKSAARRAAGRLVSGAKMDRATAIKTGFHKEDIDELEEGNAENKMKKNAFVKKTGQNAGAFSKSGARNDTAAGRASMRPQPNVSKIDMKDYKKSGPESYWKKKGIGTGVHKEEFQQDVMNLFASETELSEDFKNKAVSLFEAVVTARVAHEVEQLQDIIAEEAANVVNEMEEELINKVDAYLNYVAEQWLEQNQVEVVEGLRSEITEDFIAGLKVLFQEHYIEVPEEKYDVIGEMQAQIDELTEKLNETMEQAIVINSELAEAKRDAIFTKVTSDLAQTEIEKLRGLVEEIEFENEEIFEQKMVVVKNNYFPKSSTTLSPIVEEAGSTEISSSPTVAKYAELLSRNTFGK